MEVEGITEEMILRIFTGEEIEEPAFMGLTEELEEHLGIPLAESLLSQFEPFRGMGSIMVQYSSPEQTTAMLNMSGENFNQQEILLSLSCGHA